MQKLFGVAGGSDVFARSWRMVDRYPTLFTVGTPMSVRVAVVFGLAAKLTQNHELRVKTLWLSFAEPTLLPKVYEAERKVVMLIGRCNFASGCA